MSGFRPHRISGASLVCVYGLYRMTYRPEIPCSLPQVVDRLLTKQTLATLAHTNFFVKSRFFFFCARIRIIEQSQFLIF